MSTCVIQSAYNGVETIAVSTICTNIIKSKSLYQPLIPLHVGTVEFMQGVFNELGIKVQELGYPDELKPFYKRDIVYNGFQKNRFIKPYDCKRFDVFIRTDTDVLGYGNVLSWWSQEVVTFLQEYRVYCNGDNIMGMGRYDDLDDPDLDETEIRAFVEQVISTWKDRPIAYAIDIGIIAGRGMAVVELTDAWGMGLYKPMNMTQYYHMLLSRWDELVNDKRLIS